MWIQARRKRRKRAIKWIWYVSKKGGRRYASNEVSERWVRASKWAFCAFMSTSYTSHLFNKREKLSMNQYPITCYLPQYVFLILWSLSALYGNNKKWTQWKLCARFFLQLIVVCWTSNKRLLFVARYNYRFDRAFFFFVLVHIFAFVRKRYALRVLLFSLF